jgi:hypothetical protein
MRLLSPVEEAYLNGTRDFTKAQQRYIRYRLKKKLRLLDESRDAAAAAAAMLLRLESSLVRIPLSDIPCNKREERSSGPDVIRTRDPRHVKAHQIIVIIIIITAGIEGSNPFRPTIL